MESTRDWWAPPMRSGRADPSKAQRPNASFQLDLFTFHWKTYVYLVSPSAYYLRCKIGNPLESQCIFYVQRIEQIVFVFVLLNHTTFRLSIRFAWSTVGNMWHWKRCEYDWHFYAQLWIIMQLVLSITIRAAKSFVSTKVSERRRNNSGAFRTEWIAPRFLRGSSCSFVQNNNLRPSLSTWSPGVRWSGSRPEVSDKFCRCRSIQEG